MAEKTPRRPAHGSVARPAEPLTVKQERAARREEKLAALRAEQARRQRNARLARVGWIVGGVAVFALVVVYVVSSGIGRPDPRAVDIAGVETFADLTANHVEEAVDYPQSPPVGGNHSGTWLNCGVYQAEVPEVNGTHSLEHGAVWVGYDPEALDQADVDRLAESLPDTYVILAPSPDLADPIVLSAWGAQLGLDEVDDPRLTQFVDKYLLGPTAPEPGAPCTGGIDGPSRVA